MSKTDTPETAWQHYKNTMATAPSPCFDYARTGDLIRLRERLELLRDINEPDAKGNSVLMLAAYHGHTPMTNYLIGQGADVNSCDAAGNSILMGAVFKGHVEVIRSLLGAGANKHQQNPKGQTALQFAKMFARREVVQLLSPEPSKSRLPIWRHSLRAWTHFIFSSLKSNKTDRAYQGAQTCHPKRR